MIDEQIWLELESHRPTKSGLVRRRVREDSDRNIFLGVGYPSRQRVLILAVPRSAIEGVETPPTTRALTTQIEDLGADEVELRVWLTVPEMAQVFSPFVDDVVDTIAAVHTDKDAVRGLLDRFAHWKTLLSAAGQGGLRSHQAQGLYGELWALKHLILTNLASSEALRSWHGPDREDRDFAFETVAMEVKSTLRDRPLTVEINSERQLDLSSFSR
ncbi:MAG TPA: PD-(D/E)XK motif protein, partial [Candidatus Paceibacterota bacterium]|nr:PD-(D/E)XK motif protein [Candidatus Paceibacterota bacterium]